VNGESDRTIRADPPSGQGYFRCAETAMASGGR